MRIMGLEGFAEWCIAIGITLGITLGVFFRWFRSNKRVAEVEKLMTIAFIIVVAVVATFLFWSDSCVH